MKFIKTTDGWYIDQSKIDSFKVIETNKPKGFAVCAFIEDDRWGLKEFSCDSLSTTQFDPKEAAQAWLDNFVTKLNEDNQS